MGVSSFTYGVTISLMVQTTLFFSIIQAALVAAVFPFMGRQESTSNNTIIDQLRHRKTYLTSSEVMAILRINRATLCRHCRASLIPHVRMPDLSYRFDPVALQGWLRERSVP
jgi:Helix-turn-helix domain